MTQLTVEQENEILKESLKKMEAEFSDFAYQQKVIENHKLNSKNERLTNKLNKVCEILKAIDFGTKNGTQYFTLSLGTAILIHGLIKELEAMPGSEE